jgi:hypothetical protein
MKRKSTVVAISALGLGAALGAGLLFASAQPASAASRHRDDGYRESRRDERRFERRFERRDGYELFVPNRYSRRQDLDRDGIPNRFDRDVDGDGVPNWRDRSPQNPWRR